MDAKKLIWCFNQNKGIKLIEPNINLAEEYISSSEETFLVLQSIKDQSNIWVATTKYYCEYFAIYAILMKLAIKCEIHDCTIELCKFLEEENVIPKGYSKILENDKELRIDNQYYLKNRKVRVESNMLRDFILTIKNKINLLTLEETTNIRKKLKQII